MNAKEILESTPKPVKDNYTRSLIVFWSVTWACFLAGLLVLKFT
jgi:hypothetical protein